MGFGAVAITKVCKCGKENWYLAEHRKGKKTVLVGCKKCGNQWRTSAKYIDELPLASYLKK
jgi:DNA-directed RNA polymerase subunit M/transcription elongation factor TFIIS